MGLLAAFASATAGTVSATTASAHDAVVATAPTDGARVPQTPGQVSITLSKEPLDIGLQVQVTGPSGPVTRDAPSISGMTVTQMIRDGGPGTYRATYRVTSGDGHPVTGQLTFEVTADTSGNPTATSPSAQSADIGPTTGLATPGDTGPTSDAGASPAALPLVIGAASLAAVGAALIALRHRNN